jgi:HK97 family phage portal protein
MNIPAMLNGLRRSLFSGSGGGGSTYAIRTLPPVNSRIDWTLEAGEIRTNPIVAMCLDWSIRNATSVPIKLYTKTKYGEEVEIEGHPVLDLLQRPNPSYTGDTLIGSVITDLATIGSAYLAIAQTAGGQAGELYWLDARYVAPDFPTDGSSYMVAWQYTPPGLGLSQRFPVELIVNPRRGNDPINDRVGYAPIMACYKEIGLVNLAANYTGAITKNTGATNIIVAPTGEGSFNPTEAADLRISIQQNVSGDNAGTPLVFSRPADVSSLGMSPRDLMLTDIDMAAVSRICGALGQSPMLHGLPDSGRTYSNYRESQRSAWINGIIPLHDVLLNALNVTLLRWFDSTGRLFLKYDYANVEALAEDQKEQAARAVLLFEKGVITRNQALKIIGEEPVDDGDIYSNELGQAGGAEDGDAETEPEETETPQSTRGVQQGQGQGR